MKHNKNSKRSNKRDLQKKYHLLLLVILLIGFPGLIGCTTAQTVTSEDPYISILIDMVPDAPEVPEFPALEWSYSNNAYSITEDDADKLLDYGENELPLFRYQFDQFKRQVLLIFEALKSP